MTIGIYRIYNKTSGKSYIGQSKNVEGRLRDHFNHLNRGNHGNYHLQSAFLLYGTENFGYQLIEACEEETLTQREEYWIDAALHYAGVYNLVRPEDSKKISVETRRRIGEAAKISMIGNQHAKGYKQSEEARRKLSESLRGRVLSEEHRRKISKAAKGRVRSEETRRRMSEAKKGNKNAKKTSK